jgi:hypothetical protein
MIGVANLFDTAMVFAVDLLLAVVVSYNVPERLLPERNMTVVKNPGSHVKYKRSAILLFIHVAGPTTDHCG